MSIPQNLVDEILIKCGRRCCICRRFDPLHLQVHHIVEKSEGGDDNPDNLIATCLTCHSDVHTKTKLTRRFTAKELKGHRDELSKIVAKGNLPPVERVDDESYEKLVSTIVLALRSNLSSVFEDTPRISADAVELLLRAVRDDGSLFDEFDATPSEKPREDARIKHALDELHDHGLITWVAGIMYRVTYGGYLLADQVLAEGADIELSS